MLKLWLEPEALLKAPVGFAIIESDSGRIVDANETYCSILRRPRREVVGKTWMHFTHPDDVGGDVLYIREARRGVTKGLARAKRYLDPDGIPVRVDVTVFPASRESLSISSFPPLFLSEGEREIHISIVINRSRETTLRDRLRERIIEVHRSREALCAAIAQLTQFRDRETGVHLLRTKAYVKLLLRNLPIGSVFSEHGVRLITRASTLHDIGKVGIPDAILLKQGSLSNDEFLVMQTHTSLGAKAIRQMIRIGETDPALRYATEIAESHHERWDGSGYPHAIAGERIPLCARVMTIADVYDALRSERPYKDKLSHNEATKIIREGAGTQFDPALVRVFDSLERDFEAISTTDEGVLERLDDIE